jgi:hypothetical protein
MTEEPIKYASLARKVKARDALTEMPDISLTETMFLAGREPNLATRGIEVVQPHYTSDEQTPVFKVDVAVDRAKLGVHVFGPGMTGTKLPARRKLLSEEDNRESVVGFLPDHLALRVRPQKLDKRLVVDRRSTPWAMTIPKLVGPPRYSRRTTATPSVTRLSPGTPPAGPRPLRVAGRPG